MTDATDYETELKNRLFPKPDVGENPFTAHDSHQRKKTITIWTTLIVLFIVVVVGLPWLYRSSRLWGLPDIGPPFDIAAHSAYKPAAAEDAFTYYQLAAEELKEAKDSKAFNSSTLARYNSLEAQLIAHLMADLSAGKTDISNRTSWDSWLRENGKALALWKQGTECTKSLHLDPSQIFVNTSPSLPHFLKQLATLAIVEAQSLVDDGQFDAAWGWYRAAIRCSRHLGNHSISADRLEGLQIYSTTCQAILHHWASQPDVTDEQLATAVQHLTDDFQMTPTLSEGLKANYLVLWNSLIKYRQSNFYAWSNRSINSNSELFLWLNNEPEHSKRVLQLSFAKILAEAEAIDDAVEQTSTTVGPASTDRLQTRIIELNEQSLVYQNFIGHTIQQAQGHIREQGQQAALIAMLATHQFQRRKGRYPQSIQELQAEFPNLSFVDPCAATPGELLSYILERSSFVVRSRGITTGIGQLPGNAGASYFVTFQYRFKNSSMPKNRRQPADRIQTKTLIAPLPE